MDQILQNIILGLLFLAVSSALTGVYAYIKDDSLSADAIAHSTLPGVCIGFMLAGEKSNVYMYSGALFTGMLCQFTISYIHQHSKIKKDTLTALVLTTFFALGLVLNKFILGSRNFTNKSGLNHFLFGQAASMQEADLWFIGIASLLVVALIVFFGRALKALAFDPIQFEMYGWSKKTVQIFFDVTLTITVIIGIQTVGVVLMSALIITPAVIGRSLSHKFPRIIFFAILFNCIKRQTGSET